MAYGFLNGNDTIPIGINEDNSIQQIIHWIGFTTPNQRTSVFNDSIGSWDDIRMFSEKDMNNMARDFAGRATGLGGRINFGIRRTKKLIGLVHWVEDFYRVSNIPSIEGLSKVTFSTQLERALDRERARKRLIDQSSISAKAATPGLLENERKWKEWETRFDNYLSTMIGVNGIPLSYVTRENELPIAGAIYSNFMDETVACAPLTGQHYETDSYSVYQQILSFTTGQPSEDWIKSTKRHSDGRKSTMALRDHFAGEGNATRNLSEAERLRDSLCYKGERAMQFETFLTQMQKMFNIFDKEGEPMEEEAKIRFLFKKVQNNDLQKSVEALKAQQTTSPPGTVTYVTAANHLSTAVSELPEYISRSRNVSQVTWSDTKNPAIHNADGSIKTGEIPDWTTLTYNDKKKVFAERKRLGIRYKSEGNEQGKKKSGSDVNKMKQLEKQNKLYKRKIKALKRSNDDEEKDDQDEEKVEDAGDAFGGKTKKAKK